VRFSDPPPPRIFLRRGQGQPHALGHPLEQQQVLDATGEPSLDPANVQRTRHQIQLEPTDICRQLQLGRDREQVADAQAADHDLPVENLHQQLAVHAQAIDVVGYARNDSGEFSRETGPAQGLGQTLEAQRTDAPLELDLRPFRASAKPEMVHADTAIEHRNDQGFQQVETPWFQLQTGPKGTDRQPEDLTRSDAQRRLRNFGLGAPGDMACGTLQRKAPQVVTETELLPCGRHCLRTPLRNAQVPACLALETGAPEDGTGKHRFGQPSAREIQTLRAPLDLALVQPIRAVREPCPVQTSMRSERHRRRVRSPGGAIRRRGVALQRSDRNGHGPSLRKIQKPWLEECRAFREPGLKRVARRSVCQSSGPRQTLGGLQSPGIAEPQFRDDHVQVRLRHLTAGIEVPGKARSP